MKVVILGATSAIAHQVGRIYAASHAELFLAGRNRDRLETIAADLRFHGASTVTTHLADLADGATLAPLVSAAGTNIDVVLIAHGSLPDQKAIDTDPLAQAECFDVNATSVIALGTAFAALLESQRRGVLAVIGSVAGDRARRSNYSYGAAKAAVHAWCEGVQARLAGTAVAVVLIKPGWVDTPMTAAMKKNPLFASAATVARGIHKAIEARKSATVYLPGFWRWISLAVRAMPAKLVKF